ncbi:50S ribosomal protein L24 [Egicoccus halophilus]|uniref:Large ribosomal subunit protein uL24 n=1 Tax=Egicoccus halophilus TaxID=1670830 RepID=A0A8J3A7U5_9ACTN|nr:50S ribosomal protein L24 [Egicoccus halophilus]GGI05846.1 50S ribosomal protein L24 [Egicoccus halophilus]
MRRIRKDDQVQVIAGKDAGKSGRVIKVYTDRDRVLVEGRNYVKKHQRIQNQRGGAQEGGIIETEAAIHASNVQPICPSCDQPTRVGYRYEDQDERRSKVRVCKKCDATF